MTSEVDEDENGSQTETEAEAGAMAQSLPDATSVPSSQSSIYLPTSPLPPSSSPSTPPSASASQSGGKRRRRKNDACEAALLQRLQEIRQEKEQEKGNIHAAFCNYLCMFMKGLRPEDSTVLMRDIKQLMRQYEPF